MSRWTRPTSRSTCTARPGRAGSRSTPPTRRYASPTCPPASWSPCRTRSRRSRTGRRRCACSAPACWTGRSPTSRPSSPPSVARRSARWTAPSASAPTTSRRTGSPTTASACPSATSVACSRARASTGSSRSSPPATASPSSRGPNRGPARGPVSDDQDDHRRHRRRRPGRHDRAAGRRRLRVRQGRGPLAARGGAGATRRRRPQARPAAPTGGGPSAGGDGGAPGIKVGRGVFVPRPESELVAGAAATHLRAATAPATAVDLCTGSGAIACFLAEAVPGARVLATEVDAEALAWARRNLSDQAVDLLEGDLDEPLPDALRSGVDVLVTNVPYVPSGAIPLLPRDVRVHEPLVALDGGPDGLDVLRRVVARVGRWLAPGGWLVCEIGDDQGDTAASLLAGAGLEEVAVRPDLTGRTRMAEGRWPA